MHVPCPNSECTLSDGVNGKQCTSTNYGTNYHTNDTNYGIGTNYDTKYGLQLWDIPRLNNFLPPSMARWTVYMTQFAIFNLLLAMVEIVSYLPLKFEYRYTDLVSIRKHRVYKKNLLFVQKNFALEIPYRCTVFVYKK